MNTPRLKPGAGLGLLWMLYVAELMEYGARHELEAPGPHWYQCAYTRLDPSPRPSRLCTCVKTMGDPYGCGGCCNCLGGCQEQWEEVEHWDKRLREMGGELEPCICWYGPSGFFADPDTVMPRPPVFQINPSCPHHGDARHVCNVSALGRSTRMEGAGWRCPPCGATWVLTRVQGAEQPVRLYPTMQWIRDAPKQA